MSLTKTQIDALARRNVKANSVSYNASDLTADENLAVDRFLGLAISASGRWQVDDSNHEDYPIMETDLVANQRDYAFVDDEQGNIVLDIFKVMVKGSNGVYYEVYPVDQQSDEGTESFWDDNNVTGTPTKYDKTANGIILDVLPNYSWRNGVEGERGVKVFMNREGSYFTTSDTTKKPGFAGIFHEYVALYPSYLYAMRNDLKNTDRLRGEVSNMETAIKKHYRDRSKDEQAVITAETINSI